MNSEIFYEIDFETPYSSETEIHTTSVVSKETVRSNSSLISSVEGGGTEVTTKATAAEHGHSDEISLENSYTYHEIVNNEEFDDEEQQQQQPQLLQLLKHKSAQDDGHFQLTCAELSETCGVDFNAGSATTSKLHLSLSAEKISLKSQKAKKKINKSIEKTKSKRKKEAQQQQQNATKTEQPLTIEAITQYQQKQQQQQQKQLQQLRHAPVINFTIAPIDCVRRNSVHTSCNTNSNNKRGKNNNDAIDKRLPEIILPSTSNSNVAPPATPVRQKQYTQATSRSEAAATVTFRTAAPAHAALTNATNSSKITTPVRKVSGITPPVERGMTDVSPSKQIIAAEVYGVQHVADVGSGGGGRIGAVGAVGVGREGVIVSGGCGGNSTSPESLMDNILSAASSVSVCSSSSSSQSFADAATAGDIAAIVDIVKIPPPPPPPPQSFAMDSRQSRTGTRSSGNYAMPRPMRTINPTKIPSIAFTSPAEQRRDNCSPSNNVVSTTATNITSSCIPATISTATITTAWVHQQPMPSVRTSNSTQNAVQERNEVDTLKPPPDAMYTNRISSILLHNDLSDGGMDRKHTMRSSRSRSTSPLMTAHRSTSAATKVQTDSTQPKLPLPSSPLSQPPSVLNCIMCGELMRDPRTLNCLHSFCLQCLVEENIKADAGSMAFWSLPTTHNERRLASSSSVHSAAAAISGKENEVKSIIKCGTGGDGISGNGAGSGGGAVGGGVGPASGANAYSKCNGDSGCSHSPETSSASGSPSRRTSFNFIRKKSLEKILLMLKPDNNKSETIKLTPVASTASTTNCDCAPTTPRVATTNRLIWCKVCNYATEVPVGGLRQLPQNLLLARKIDAFKRQNQQLQNASIVSASISSTALLTATRLWCGLCATETEAVFNCLDCALYLCTLCKESHERQRSTASHKLQLLPIDVRRQLRPELAYDIAAKATTPTSTTTMTTLKCSMHGGYEMKTFCVTCLQVACADCVVLLHRGHKHESIGRAVATYARILSESAEQTRPLCTYAEQTIAQLDEIAEHVNSKCDHVQAQLETFIEEYMDALTTHRMTLLQQLQKAREAKLHMLIEQQAELARRTKEASEAVRFTQELAQHGSDAELLSFVSVLLKRFEYCQQIEAPDDKKICDTLQLLRQARAPDTQHQHYSIPLYGIITTQAVAPSLCAIVWQSGGKMCMARKIELTLVTRDCHDLPLSHGGMDVQARLHHSNEQNATALPTPPAVAVHDNRDGTYALSFTPNATGHLLLSVSINDTAIKGSPFSLHIGCMRAHTGVYHCCSQCSSKAGGSRQQLRRCACTPNAGGCAHGQPGHPGARHWSCCGSQNKNSECYLAQAHPLPQTQPQPTSSSVPTVR